MWGCLRSEKTVLLQVVFVNTWQWHTSKHDHTHINVSMHRLILHWQTVYTMKNTMWFENNSDHAHFIALPDGKPKPCYYPNKCLTQYSVIGNSGVKCNPGCKYISKAALSLIPVAYLRMVFWADSVGLDTGAISSNTPMLPPLRLLLWFLSLPSWRLDI